MQIFCLIIVRASDSQSFPEGLVSVEQLLHRCGIKILSLFNTVTNLLKGHESNSVNFDNKEHAQKFCIPQYSRGYWYSYSDQLQVDLTMFYFVLHCSCAQKRIYILCNIFITSHAAYLLSIQNGPSSTMEF